MVFSLKYFFFDFVVEVMKAWLCCFVVLIVPLPKKFRYFPNIYRLIVKGLERELQFLE